jgi:predicted kinase
MQQLFIQMSGAPGSGKTTIAKGIAHRIGAVVIDHDVTKSALLAADVPVDLAGAASYQVLGAMAQHLLSQGFHVIFDSPCYYRELLERGQQLAQAAGATYLYIECLVADLDELDRRLRTRPSLPSQVTGVYLSPADGNGQTPPGSAVFQEWITGMKRPLSNYLLLDTTRPLAVNLEKAMLYIKRVG